MTDTDTTAPALVDHALRAATRAPSVHNTQPWRFVVAPTSVDLYLDRTRVLTVDPGAREGRISCGPSRIGSTIGTGLSCHVRSPPTVTLGSGGSRCGGDARWWWDKAGESRHHRAGLWLGEAVLEVFEFVA